MKTLKFNILTASILGMSFILFSCGKGNNSEKTEAEKEAAKIGLQVTNGVAYDIDSNEYKTIIIGDIEWFAENLKTTKYNDGSDIELVTENNAWATNNTGAYCYYDNDENNKKDLGALYNYKAVSSEKICPEGWSVPNDSIWKVLTDSLMHGNDNAAYYLKTTDTTYWNGGNKNATNESQFSALAAGFRERDGEFHTKGTNAFWWTATKHNDTNAMYEFIDNDNPSVTESHISREVGLSVRCVKN